MLQHKGGLDELVLTELLEEQRDDIAPLVLLLHLDVVLLGNGDSALQIGDLVKVHAGILLHQLHHGGAAEGLAHIDNNLAEGQFHGVVDLLADMLHQAFGALHHAVHIGIGLIELNGGELGVVGGVHAFVTEQTTNLVHPIKAADDAALQIQLGGNTQVQIHIQRIVMGDKGTGGSTTLNDIQNGGIHFQIAQLIKITTDSGDGLGTLDKSLAHLGIDDQIHVALTVAGVHILQAVVLFGQGQQALAQQRVLLHLHRDLTAAGTEHDALDTDDITDIQLLEPLVLLGADLVDLHIDLDLALLVLNVAEGSLAHVTLGHDTTGDGNFLVFHLLKIVQDLLAVGGALKTNLYERIHAGFPQSGQLFTADTQQFVKIFLRGLCHDFSILIHILFPLFIW